MLKQTLRTVFTYLGGACLLVVAAHAEAQNIVFTNVHVVPMDEEQVLKDHAVVISDDRITAVVPMDGFQPPQDATLIDGEGRYLLPGLSEMHGHVPPRQSEQFPQRYLDDTLFLYLAGGVTTVRGMLGHDDQLQLKDEVASGTRLGPTLYLAGPSFNGNSVQSPEQARQMVQQHSEAGWDLLKVHPGLELEEFTALAEEAERLGMPFAGHIPQSVPLDRAMELGIRTIDHLDGYLEFIDARDRVASDEELRSLAELTKQSGVGVVPTQALWATLIGAADPEQLSQYDEVRYMPQSVVNGWQRYLDNAAESRYYSGESAAVHQQNRQRLLQILHQEGVEILMGTDAPQVYSVPGLGLKHELAMMEAAGLTPYEVLRTGTVAVGQYFQDQDTFGQIRPGHRADVLLLADNPLLNLSTLSHPEGVLVRGRWLDRDELDQGLAEIEAAYQGD